MKRITPVFCLILCLLLAGCGQKLPEKTADGIPWEERWVTLGSCVGVETPEGWTVQRNEDLLAAEGIYYAVWSTGEALTYTNEAGDAITTHDAEIHLVVTESETPEAAAATAAELEGLTLERYPDAVSSEAEYAGQAFRIWTYGEGASAAALRGSCVIRLDVTALERFDRSPYEVLTQFLSCLHYAE